MIEFNTKEKFTKVQNISDVSYIRFLQKMKMLWPGAEN
jgi:hypothetical protein